MAGDLEAEAAPAAPAVEPMVPPRDPGTHGMMMSLVKASQSVLDAAGRIAEQARESVDTSRKLSDTAVLVAEEAQRTIRSMREAADMEIAALRRRLEETTQLPPQRLVAAAVEGPLPAPEVVPPPSSRTTPAAAAPVARLRAARPARDWMARDRWLLPVVILVGVVVVASLGILFWRMPGGGLSASATTQGVFMSAPPPRGDVGRSVPQGSDDRIPNRYLAPDDRGGE